MNLIHKIIKRYMAWAGMTLYAADPDDDRIELNLGLASTVSDEEIAEFDQGMGGEKKPTTEGAADSDQNADLEEEDLLAAAGGSEEQSGAKRSEAELEAGTEAERTAIREHKRQSRLNQQQRAREKIASLERQLANALAREQSMNQRVGNLETNNLGTQAANLEQAAVETSNAIDHWKRVIADGTVKGDGQAVADATANLVQLQRRTEMIDNARQNLQQTRQQPQQRPPANPQVQVHVNAFMRANPWYQPKTNDPDSAVISSMDAQLTKEGWDPASPSYWAELQARSSAYSPTVAKRFGSGQQSAAIAQGGSEGKSYNPANTQRPQRSPVAGSSASSNPGGGENTRNYRLSPQRVQFMKEAGYWNDPKERADMTRRYMESDREDAANRRT